MKTVLLFVMSTTFMTTAWYGHLKFKSWPLLTAIVISWLIALPEYMLQVPANRLGHGRFSAPQLKIMAEVISLIVFFIFSIYVLKERPTPNHMISFVFIIAAVYFAFMGPFK